MQVHVWIRDLSELFGNFQHDPDRLATLLHSLHSLKSYLNGLLRCPHEHTSTGMIHALSAARVDGSPVSNDEIVANVIVTLIGGHETTTNLIASGYLTSIQNQGTLELLLRRPNLMGTAVEELLRYESPVQHTARIAPCDLELWGKKIAKRSSNRRRAGCRKPGSR